MLTLFLCGDVMTGRGIDQILPHPCDPELHEPYVRNAMEYVRLTNPVTTQANARYSTVHKRAMRFIKLWDPCAEQDCGGFISAAASFNLPVYSGMLKPG